MDTGIAIALGSLILVVCANLVAVGRWCGRVDKLHGALFDADGDSKLDLLKNDVTAIKSRLENGLLHNVDCLQEDMKDVRDRIGRLEEWKRHVDDREMMSG